MVRKDVELIFKKSASVVGYTRKFRDAGYVHCPSCHRAVMQCPHCRSSLLLPKADHLPDYLVATRYFFVECKQGEETWSLDDFTPTQKEVMDSHPDISWVFLEIGPGRRPGGRHAYLIPWSKFAAISEIAKTRSVRYEKTERSRSSTAEELFGEYRLTWEEGLWKFPSGWLA